VEDVRVNAQAQNFRPPTDRQIELMTFMASYFEANDEWPSHRQMAAALEINSPNLSPYLNLLEAKGLLIKIAGKSRRNRALTKLGRKIVTDQEWQPRLI
jgi:predicted transcriptional regulator